MTPTAPQVSVIVPTIGRPEQLTQCLAALAKSTAPPDEIIVVDQSGCGVANSVVSTIEYRRILVVDDDGRGAGRARNQGASAAMGDLLLFIDDDCRPDQSWTNVAADLHRVHPTAMLTGSVLAEGSRESVPSTREDPEPCDHTGTRNWAALYSGNMAVSRGSFLAFGGFDERFPAAGGEDNDLCYRWLRAGRELRYEPELKVVHLDWRTASELEQVWKAYGNAQGIFYAKHLRAGDLNVLRFLLIDVLHLARARAAGVPMRTPAVPALGPTLHSMIISLRKFR